MSEINPRDYLARYANSKIQAYDEDDEPIWKHLNSAVRLIDSLTSQLEALKQENEELRKERDLFRHNLNKYAPNKKYQEVLDDIAKLREGV